MDTYRVYAYNPTTTKTSITEVKADSMEAASKMVMMTHLPFMQLVKISKWCKDETIPDGGYWDIQLQQIYTPVDGRIETGPLKINDDWCGYFIRGDNAIGLSFEADSVEEWFKSLPEEHKKGVWITINQILSTLKEMSICRSK